MLQPRVHGHAAAESSTTDDDPDGLKQVMIVSRVFEHVVAERGTEFGISYHFSSSIFLTSIIATRHKNQHGVAAYLWALAMVLAAAEAAAAAAAEPESTDSMEHCRYESAEAWRRGERSRALQSDK